MNNFRIIQTQAFSADNPLPYEVEEYRKVWYLPWMVWRPLREQFVPPFTFRSAIMRFQTPREAKLHIEQLLVIRGRQQAEQKIRIDEQAQSQLLPRVVEVFR